MKSFPNDTVDNHPGYDQEHQEVPLNSSNLLNPSTDMKHLIAIKYLYDQISWRTVAYLPPELFHSSLTIRLTNIMHGGRGLIERNPTVRVPTFLRSPGAICKYGVRQLARFYFSTPYFLYCSHSKAGWAGRWRSWRGRRGSRWLQWCSKHSQGRPSWWQSSRHPNNKILRFFQVIIHLKNTLKIGASCPTTDMPPTPRYWPTDTSRKNRGTPHTSMEKKYGIRKAPMDTKLAIKNTCIITTFCAYNQRCVLMISCTTSNLLL